MSLSGPGCPPCLGPLKTAPGPDPVGTRLARGTAPPTGVSPPGLLQTPVSTGVRGERPADAWRAGFPPERTVLTWGVRHFLCCPPCHCDTLSCCRSEERGGDRAVGHASRRARSLTPVLPGRRSPTPPAGTASTASTADRPTAGAATPPWPGAGFQKSLCSSHQRGGSRHRRPLPGVARGTIYYSLCVH